MKAKSIIKLVLTVLIIAALACLAIFGLKIGGFKIPNAYDGITFGLDIAGGTSVTYEAKGEVSSDQAATVIETMRKRLDGNNFTEATVAREGSNRFTVEIPDVTDTQKVVDILGTTANLSFVDIQGQIILEGKNVKSATAQQINDPVTNMTAYVVSLKFDDEGAKKFADATSANVGNPIFIFMDYNTEKPLEEQMPISYPVVQEPILNGEAQISGDFTYDEVRELALLINSGNLPVELDMISLSTVEATLGENSLVNAVKAAIIALIIIMLFMIAFYRIPGVMASIALCAYTVVTVLAMILFKVNLTLSGIAGIVLSMGMAVDANVVIFERIIDELKIGKSIGGAVEAGFDRALAAVVDSNITTVISSLALYFFGTGTVKGFAITLLIGVIVSMFTAILLTKSLLKTMVHFNVKNRKLFGFGIKA